MEVIGAGLGCMIMGDRKMNTLDYEPANATRRMVGPRNLFNTVFILSIGIQIVVVYPIVAQSMHDGNVTMDGFVVLCFVHAVWFGLCSIIRIAYSDSFGYRWGGLIGFVISLFPLTIYIVGA